MNCHVKAALLVIQVLITWESSWAQARREDPAKAAERHHRVSQRREDVHVICHRGAVEFAHENTLEAYRAALELGADGNEIDVRRTKDGVLVCFHDDMVDHLLEGYGDVGDYSWSDLQKLKFRNPGRFGQYCRLPTLRETFELHRDHAGLLFLDVKQPGLVEPIEALLDEFDLWDHVVHVPPEFTNPRIQRLHHKAGLYLDRTEVNAAAITSALQMPGDRILLEYPQIVAQLLGRTIATPSYDPVKDEIAAWAAQPASELRTDPRSIKELIDVLRDSSDWNVVAIGDAAEAESAERILRRAMAADELARRRVRTPAVFTALEDQVRNRSLHRNWRYCGLDGSAALRALLELKAPRAVEVARYCLWRDDPVVDAVRNPAFDSPRSWSDWRTKLPVFQLLESFPGAETEQLCRDYLALSDDAARTIGVPQFESAAKTLLAVSPNEATVKELLNHRLSEVRGRAILFCLDNPERGWAVRIADQIIRKPR